MVYFKENYKFTRIRGLGSKICQEGPTFPGGGGVYLFSGGGGGGGGQMLILATHRTCNFPGRGADPLSYPS